MRRRTVCLSAAVLSAAAVALLFRTASSSPADAPGDAASVPRLLTPDDREAEPDRGVVQAAWVEPEDWPQPAAQPALPALAYTREPCEPAELMSTEAAVPSEQRSEPRRLRMPPGAADFVRPIRPLESGAIRADAPPPSSEATEPAPLVEPPMQAPAEDRYRLPQTAAAETRIAENPAEDLRVSPQPVTAEPALASIEEPGLLNPLRTAALSPSAPTELSSLAPAQVPLQANPLRR